MCAGIVVFYCDVVGVVGIASVSLANGGHDSGLWAAVSCLWAVASSLGAAISLLWAAVSCIWPQCFF